MEFIRVRSYLQTGEFTGCEHLYLGNRQDIALDRFSRDYPEHKDCIIVAEYYDSEDEKNKEHFNACMRCGCVH